MSELVVIALFFVLGPIWIVFHYITKWRESKGLTNEDEKLLQDLWESAQHMESRINTLETILDEERKEWRKKT